MPDEETTSMGDLIRFPRGQQADTEGAAVRALAKPTPTTDNPTTDNTATSTHDTDQGTDDVGQGSELVPDTASRALVRLPRRPILPPAVKDKTLAAGDAAWRHTRRHTAIVLKGVEQQRQARKSDRDQADLKTARRAAVERGDYAEAREISRQMVQERTVNVEAWKARIDLAWSITKKAAIALIIITGVAVVTGLVNAFGHWLGPWDALDVLYLLGMIVASVFTTVRFVVTNWVTLAPAVLGLVTAVWLSRRWRDGKRLGEHVLPVDLRKGDRVALVDFNESALVAALANIGIPALKEHVKEGWPNRPTDRAWVQFPIPDGNGMTVKLRLPLAAPVERVRKAKVTLAHNLGCLPQELWVDKDRDDPTVLDLFRLNPGELRKPAPPHPLLHEGTTDYFKGFPVGVSPRGEPITGHAFERNHVYSGRMGSGKTELVLDMLIGAVLDPLVDVDVFCFAENADYDALKPCFKTFVMGDTADNVQACREHIQDLHDDLSERGRLLQKHGVTSVNREVAAKERGLRPRVVVIDECQSYFRQSDPKERKAIIDEIVRFYSAARKYAITLIFVTPVPSDQSLPRDLVSVTSNLACGAIKDKTRNNVVLGDKAHENGISALGLKPRNPDTGELNDTGTLITVGFTDVDGAVLRTYYTTREEKEQIAARALEIRGGATGAQEPQKRDPGLDALEVMGSEPARASSVIRAMAARWSHYQGWGIQELVDALATEGYRVPSTDRKWEIDPAKLRAALSARDASEE